MRQAMEASFQIVAPVGTFICGYEYTKLRLKIEGNPRLCLNHIVLGNLAISKLENVGKDARRTIPTIRVRFLKLMNMGSISSRKHELGSIPKILEYLKF